MRHDRIVPGVILIALGLIFLLHSFGYLHIHFMNILHLWPVFLLIGGINLIFAHNRSGWATALKIGVVLLAFWILLFGNFGNRFSFWPNHYYYHSDSDFDDDDDSTGIRRDIVKVEGNSTFTEAYHANVRIAKLNINGGGTNYRLSDTTNQLFEAYTHEFAGKYEYTHSNQDSVYTLNFGMKDGTHILWSKRRSNSATFKLNSAPIWDMDIETGATKVDFDLSKFKVRNLKVDGGAADFDLKLGEPLAETRINVSTGISDVKISVPKDAACRIDTDSGLSQNKFEGFNKVSDDHYETPNFSSAKTKIFIKIDGAISDFKVLRY